MIVVNPGQCVGCGQCFPVCPVEAISVWGVASVNSDDCTECHECLWYCPVDALEVHK
ncbi:MAG: 4Fe-4S binding protein [Thermodesulfobacteriota bacterium]|nr:4Fe-4S binding protein [Thermodesulfobacteriota bacterium]